MGEQLFTSLTSIALAIVGVAIIATLVSKNAQTPQVLQAAGGAFSTSLSAALAPVVGTGNIIGGFSQY